MHPSRPRHRITTLTFGLILLLTTRTATVPAHAETNLPPDPAQTLEALRKKYDLPAMAVVVLKDGKICDRAATGVRKAGSPVPVTTNDVFHIGSCTKPMTATLAAILIEEGKLRWDTTIAKIFPELKGRMHPQYETVTVEQLLQNRGGVPSEPPAAAWKRAWEENGSVAAQRQEFITAILTAPPEAAPGTKMIYSNQGYTIVGAMLEKATGQTWEALITEKLFRPLHMDSAGFGPLGNQAEINQPWGHRKMGLLINADRVDNPPAIGPAGRVHCTLTDLAQFAQLHLAGEKPGQLLKPETFRRLHQPPAQGDYAGGWIVQDRKWAGGKILMHDGSNTRWYVVMWLAPEKDFAVIVGSNCMGEGVAKAVDEVASTMIKKWLPQ